MTTTEISKLTGLSTARIKQFAKSAGIQKTGRDYHFTEEQYQAFLARIGKWGRPGKEKV